jgi:hypothetical protein
MGGGNGDEVKALIAKNVALIPVSCDDGGNLLHLYKTNTPIPEKTAWINYYRSDDFASTVWFYLDKSESTLPSLLPAAERV